MAGCFFCSILINLEAPDPADAGLILLTALITGAVAILLQLVFYLLYSRRYTRSMLQHLQYSTDLSS